MPGGRCHVQCASVVVVLSCLVDDEVVHHGVDGTARCNGFCNEFLRVGGCIHVRLDVEALQNQLVISPCIIPTWDIRHGTCIGMAARLTCCTVNGSFKLCTRRAASD